MILFLQELTAGLGEQSHHPGKPLGLKDGLVGPNNDLFMPPNELATVLKPF